MDMIDEELMRLHNRMQDLKLRVIPEFENKTQMLYSQIMALPKDSPDRQRMESEYRNLSGELSRRSDEMINIKQQIDNLETEKQFRR